MKVSTTTRWLLLGTLLSAPYLVMLLAGTLWLHDRGWLVAWLVINALVMGLVWFFSRWPRPKKHRQTRSAEAVEPDPRWSPAAVAAAVERSAGRLACPADWEPLFEGDDRTKCYGRNGRTSFFGHGLVDALAATRR